MTNQFGVTSTIMKVDFSKTIVKKNTIKKKKTSKTMGEKPKETSTPVKEVSNNVNYQTLERLNTLTEKSKAITNQKAAIKKQVTYVIKNTNIAKESGAQIGVVVKKEMNKKAQKHSPKRESINKEDKFERLKKKLGKLDILTDQGSNTNMEGRTIKCRLEQLNFTIFSTPKNKKADPIIDEKLLLTDRVRYNKANEEVLVKGSCRVENISRLLEKHHNHLSGESAATSSDSVKKQSRKRIVPK